MANMDYPRAGLHYHLRALPDSNPNKMRANIRKNAAILRRKTTEAGLKCITIDDYVGPGSVNGRQKDAYFFDALIDDPGLMGPDCRIAGVYGKYMAVYFDAGDQFEHAFDIVRFVEVRSDIGHVIILAPSNQVMPRMNKYGQPTNELYQLGNRPEKFSLFPRPNLPRSFMDIIYDYRDSLFIMLPHINYNFDAGIMEMGQAQDERGRGRHLEAILQTMQEMEIGWEFFNASTAWFQSNKSILSIAQEIKEGHLPQGLVGDDTYFNWIGNNTIGLKMDYSAAPYQSEEIALMQLIERMGELSDTLKNGRFYVNSLNRVPWPAFVKKIAYHGWWHIQFKLGFAE